MAVRMRSDTNSENETSDAIIPAQVMYLLPYDDMYQNPIEDWVEEDRIEEAVCLEPGIDLTTPSPGCITMTTLILIVLLGMFLLRAIDAPTSSTTDLDESPAQSLSAPPESGIPVIWKIFLVNLLLAQRLLASLAKSVNSSRAVSLGGAV